MTAESVEARRVRDAAYYTSHRAEKLAYCASYYRAHREEKLAYKAEYNVAVRQPRKDDRRHFLNAMKVGAGCLRCGTRAGLLHFHHRDPATKLFKVADNVLKQWSELMAEIFKCDVLCNSCHAQHHTAQRMAARHPCRVRG